MRKINKRGVFPLFRVVEKFKSRGRPLLQGVPSFKTVHRTVLKFTPCGALLRQGISHSAEYDQRLCLWNSQPLEKAGETFNSPFGGHTLTFSTDCKRGIIPLFFYFPEYISLSFPSASASANSLRSYITLSAQRLTLIALSARLALIPNCERTPLCIPFEHAEPLET